MILRAENIKKKYGQLEVLKGVSLEIPEKNVVSIVGASGAGKSTLLHIMSTLDVADEGRVVIKDQDITNITGNSLANFRNKEIGFIFQFHNLLPEFTALENVCIPGFLAKNKDKEVLQRGEFLLEQLGLKDRIKHKPSELSGGEQQRTAVARALLNNPSIVFADEPSGNLDSKNAGELHDLFFKLKEDFGQTFVIVTHNNSLAEMADITFTMKDGVII